ncbi:uncharacterized protein CHSO_2774 [Chryseobacterium sp. StRB126]|uniref:DUF2931 family protein n=1 Tax=Chryseobacterium sp. StRB126 TaxID=878220 RepID=UPI0004E98EB6|nr:DUF2931 family protein [Chryseobacterium sp. StRB126]BAP31811.1 uncharacterized protein CHSO_2774 [Chryseobacterium sp. StRB126]
MKEKNGILRSIIMINRIKDIIIISLGLSLVVSCQPKDKFEWNAAWSAPKFYGNGGPFVEFFYQGKSIAGASASIGADPGWGLTSGGYAGGDIFKPVPDSVFVKWICAIDGYRYEGGSKLPKDKMLDLFKNGRDSKEEKYSQIIAGFAPGGNVTVWMSGQGNNKEIINFKAENKGVWKESEEAEKIEKEILSSEKFINSEVNIYRYLHGVPYSVWEKGEKTYKYDIGFSSEENRDFYESVTAFSKDGSYIFLNENQFIIPYKDWLSNHIMDGVKEGKLPVHTVVQWISEDDKQWYKGEIVFPVDFQNTFESFYQKNKNVHIVYVMDKLNASGNYTFGTIWLQSSTSKECIMKFRLAKLNNETRKYDVSKYTLPKGFVVPKWEGRIPLQKPTDLEYWQEE